MPIRRNVYARRGRGDVLMNNTKLHWEPHRISLAKVPKAPEDGCLIVDTLSESRIRRATHCQDCKRRLFNGACPNCD